MTYSFYKGRTGVQPSSGGGGVQSVTATSPGVFDNTDPLNPVYVPVLDSQNFTSQWSGIWADPVEAQTNYINDAGVITITLRQPVLAAASISGIIELDNPIPEAYWPPQDLNFIIRIEDNAVFDTGLAILGADGSIKIYRNTNLGNFSGSSAGGATSGFFATTFHYEI